ncbi:hypothetical protein JDN40_07625 [Rhodomicrobium vannielii ATCC 17100]|uniref:hypothetical protein n=1 Tax=Rhodomicrobium vannielii TaxID=1069 RepID=UPI0019183376|nr:hypothetical protein [Rhodomicrobium vannielii]MBJ7533968.1 hypothetical protein [Rhodomicrobium vannielii ATCC 17100]
MGDLLKMVLWYMNTIIWVLSSLRVALNLSFLQVEATPLASTSSPIPFGPRPRVAHIAFGVIARRQLSPTVTVRIGKRS